MLLLTGSFQFGQKAPQFPSAFQLMQITVTEYREAEPDMVHRKCFYNTCDFIRVYLTHGGKEPEIIATWKAVPRGKSVSLACLLKVQ